MMTAEFMLSKRPVLRFTAALFFLLKLFSSHIYCIPKDYICSYDKWLTTGQVVYDNWYLKIPKQNDQTVKRTFKKL